MKLKLVVITTVLMIFLMGHIKLQVEKNNADEIIASFVEVYNKNSSMGLGNFFNSSFEKSDKRLVRYWQEIFTEYGPVSIKSLGEENFGTKKIAWCKGDYSKDWVGFSYKVNESGKIESIGVLRNAAPLSNDLYPSIITEEKLNTYLYDYLQKMEAHDLFSGSVLVAKGDKVLFNQSFGFSDKENQKKNNTHTKYLIASSTKMFTSIAIAQLIESGKLELSVPISNYIKNYPEHIAGQVTVEQLLTHTSGIELDDIQDFNSAIDKAASVQEMIEAQIKYLPKMKGYRNFKPALQYNYTNEGFDLLGYIIEAVSGQGFYEYVSEHIFKKLNLKNTTEFDAEKTELIAKGYKLSNAAEETGVSFNFENNSFLPRRSRPSTSFMSTTEDMYRFLLELNKGRLIQTKTLNQFACPKVTVSDHPLLKIKYGYGCIITQKRHGEAIGHAGNWHGVSTRCEYYEKGDYYVIVLSNYERVADKVANHISEILP